jgi:hypothetical protein
VKGKLSTPTLTPEFIPLAHGSIFYTPDGSGNLVADVLETPRGNAYFKSYNSFEAQNNMQLQAPEGDVDYDQIYIDPFTGRARLEHRVAQ